MIKKNTQKALFLLLLAFFFSPLTSFAEGETLIELSPKTPTPYSPITATIVSYVFDLNLSTITWTRNGKVLLKGVGEKKLTLQMGGSGDSVPLHVKIVGSDNSTTDMDITLIPGSVDILYETPESYTPLFYEGRSLPAEGALVRFIAMPNISEGGKKVPMSSLSYYWYVNDELMEDASGLGRYSGLFNLDFFNVSTRVKVIVRSPRGAVAEKYIDVYAHEVMPLVYTYDDIFGADYTNLITKRFETAKNFTLALEPFYLSSKGPMGDSATYNWAIDGLPVTPFGGRLLSMQPKENSYGSKMLNITVANTKRRLQEGSTDINLIFDTRK